MKLAPQWSNYQYNLGLAQRREPDDDGAARYGLGPLGGALVGTFLGVLLAYGMVNPFANRCRAVIEQDGAMYHVVKQIIIASLHGHPQPLVIEAARSGIDHKNQPGFAEVFDGLRGK